MSIDMLYLGMLVEGRSPMSLPFSRKTVYKTLTDLLGSHPYSHIHLLAHPFINHRRYHQHAARRITPKCC